MSRSQVIAERYANNFAARRMILDWLAAGRVPQLRVESTDTSCDGLMPNGGHPIRRIAEASKLLTATSSAMPGISSSAKTLPFTVILDVVSFTAIRSRLGTTLQE